ncbi:hypothetical protein GOQ29_13595 [Clostridium sp. D2Q-14]|uniref:FGGY-family carbohydrate kinase n=1 Tax=Anaeromonas gelatinilytica TaxID=2683194 RepID=UPI00193C2F96|nr:FGGY family carbohydrate kinase [Anaeromonas gelatinilytica]MBS4536652.1 hypothetical protein [Anaeromonas gelatinilytica]
MSKPLAITIDIGTTNSKVSLFEIATGRLVSRESFQTKKVGDDFGELFDLESIWSQLLIILNKFVHENSGNVDSINISSVGEAGVLINTNGDVITPLIAWYDKRSVQYIKELTEEQRKRIYDITGLPAHSNYSLSKIKWLMDKIVTNKTQVYTWLNIPDLLSYFLTNTCKTEYSMASRTMCFDLKKRAWSDELLAMFHLEGKIKFPEVISSGEVVGYTSEGNTSLKKEKISVRIAGHDHMVGALGIGLDAKELLNSTGTTEGLLLIGDADFISEEHFEQSLSNGIFTDPNYCSLFSSVPTGGSAFKWYRTLFNKQQEKFQQECADLYEQYKYYSNNAIDLTKQVLILPHFNGSGAPYKNSRSTGLFYGIDLNTETKDILFGLVFGLCLEMKYVANCFPIEKTECMIVIGPAIKNPLWLQMKADALNKEVKAVKMEEAVSFGALKTAYPTFSFKISYNSYYPQKERVQEFDKVIKDYDFLYKKKIELMKK